MSPPQTPFLLSGNVDDFLTCVESGVWQCAECGYQSNRTNVRDHIEAKHVGSEGYACSLCPMILKNKIGLRNHLSRCHKQIKQLNWNWLISFLRFQKVLSPWWSGLMEGIGNVLAADICQARNSMLSVTWRLSTWHPLNMSVPTAPAHLRIELL